MIPIIDPRDPLSPEQALESREIYEYFVAVEVSPGSAMGRTFLQVCPVNPLPAELDPNISTVCVALDHETTAWLIAALQRAQRFHEHDEQEELA